MEPQDVEQLIVQGNEQSEMLRDLSITSEQQLEQGDELSSKLSNLSQDNEHALIQRDEIKGVLEEVVQAIKDIPQVEIPEAKEPLEEVSVKNFPEIQKVELINPPSEKDDSKQIELLEEILEETKKKEEYDYDIEITPELKEELRGERGERGEQGERGERGEQGIPGTPGKDADPTDFEAIKIDYKQIVNRPDIDVILQKHARSSKTTSLSELDDVDLSQLSLVDGKYVLSPGSQTAEWDHPYGDALYTYNVDGSVNTKIVGTTVLTFSYNLDGSVNTVTDGTNTKTFSYTIDGDVEGITYT